MGSVGCGAEGYAHVRSIFSASTSVVIPFEGVGTSLLEGDGGDGFVSMGSGNL